MSELDIRKEAIAYYKFWLGVIVISGIGLVSWLLSNAETASELKIFSAVITIGFIGLSAFFVHKRIERIISSLREL